MISMTPVSSTGECVDSVLLEPIIHEESKTLIWITAKDKSKFKFLTSLDSG